jgi:hypothetical protein
MNFLPLTKTECRINVVAWDEFRTHYMLGNLQEVEACNFIWHYYVKLGSTLCSSASGCVASAKAGPDFRISRTSSAWESDEETDFKAP